MVMFRSRLGRGRRAAARLAATLVLAAPVLPATAESPAVQSPAAPVAAAQAAATPALDWAHAGTDLPVDPVVKFGQLPNGMRYAIMRNTTPVGQVVLRLRIGSGSLQESDAQQGLAHFLEHMAFRGSRHVPQGEMIKTLQRKGLAFGPDTNAFTAFGQTVYKLDLPEPDADTVDTGLMMLREVASELNLDPKAFDAERGVILSEERQADTPQYRLGTAWTRFVADGQLPARRMPIGQIDVIRNAPVSLLQDYYRANYRPDNATLIVVGDIDAGAMEAKIRDRFGSWQAAGSAGSAPDFGAVRQRGLTADVVELPGAPTSVQVSFARPYDMVSNTVERRRRDIVEAFGPKVLDRRLSRLAQGADAPFQSGDADTIEVERAVNTTTFQAEANFGDWRRALQALVLEYRRLMQFGVSQGELDREIAERRTALQADAATAATRRSVNLANALVDAVHQDKTFTTPAADLALFESVVKDLKAEDVNKTLPGVFGGAGPLVQLDTPKTLEGGAATLRAEFEKASAITLIQEEAKADIAWPYTAFGTPGQVVERQELADLDAVSLRFANNVRLIVKPTTFSDDQILVHVAVGHGLRDLPAQKPSAWWGNYGFIAGGLKALDQAAVERAFAGIKASSSFSVDEQFFSLWGGTRRADLAAQLQLLTARLSAPGFRPEGFTWTKSALASLLEQAEATPAGVLARDLKGILYNGDPRWQSPTLAELDAADPHAFERQIMPVLSQGPIEVTIVGNVTVDEATRLVAQTFGALPARPADPEARPAQSARFPDVPDAPIRLTHKGRADQAIGLAAWSAPDSIADMARARALIIAGDVIEARLTEAIRVAEGATYSPTCDVDPSAVFSGYGYAYCYVETPPDKVERVFTHLDAIVADIAASGVPEDEFLRARTPFLERLKREMRTNNYWLQALAGAASDPLVLKRIRSRVGDIEAMTAKDVQAAVATYLAGKKPLKMMVLPEVGVRG